MENRQHFEVEKEKQGFPLSKNDFAEFPRELCVGKSHSLHKASKHLRRRSSWHSSSSSSFCDDDDLDFKDSSLDARGAKLSNDIYRRSIALLNGGGSDDDDNNDDQRASIRGCISPPPNRPRLLSEDTLNSFDDLDDVSPKMAKMMESALSKASSHEVIQRRLQRDQAFDQLQELRRSSRSRRTSSKTERQIATSDDNADLDEDFPTRTLLPIKSKGLNIPSLPSPGSNGRRSSSGHRAGKPVKIVDSSVLDPPPGTNTITTDSAIGQGPPSAPRKSRSQSPVRLKSTQFSDSPELFAERSRSSMKSRSVCLPLPSENMSKRRLLAPTRMSFSEKDFVMGENSDDDDEAVRVAFLALAKDGTVRIETSTLLPPDFLSSQSEGPAIIERSSRKRSPFGRGRRSVRSPEPGDKKWSMRMSPFGSRKSKSEEGTDSEENVESEQFQLKVSEHCMPSDQAQDDLYHYAVGEGDGVSCLQLTCAGSVAKCSFAPLGTVV